MSGDAAFEEINEAKFNMDHIYDRADPRAYFRELKKFGYAIPGTAKPVFRQVIDHLRRRRRGPVDVLDLGCSYGINAALLKYDLDLVDLYRHWGNSDLDSLLPEEVIRRDRRFFSNLDSDDMTVLGLDQAENAVTFATSAGILDGGFALDLEEADVPAAARADLAKVDLVTSTGCVGYVTEKTFDRLLPTFTRGKMPWIANFVLRMFPFDAIEQTLSEWGYVTEKLPGRAFTQRRFASEEERGQVLEQLRERGLCSDREKEESLLLAEFYLSRPKKDAEAMPLGAMLAG